MRKLVVAVSAVVAVALAPVVVDAVPASAQTNVIHDAVGDDKTGEGHGDITWVRVNYGEHRVTVKIKAAESGDVEYYQDLYVDVRRADSKPDMLISSNGDGESWSVGFVDDWRLGGYRSRCSGGLNSATYDNEHHFVRYSFPSTCLMKKGAEQPKRIRVSLVTRPEWEANFDWAPAPRTFGRWIAWK